VDTTEPIISELEDFIAAVSTGSVPVSRPESAVDVIRLVEAAEASMSDGGARITLDSRAGGSR
jgi:hypothetical protein